MAFNLKATNLVDRVETADVFIRRTLQEFWSGLLNPTGSTGDIARERKTTIESLAKTTKNLLGWARELLPVRGVFAANETVATSLAMEPKLPWVAAMSSPTSPLPPRWMLVNAMSESKELLSWTRGQKALPNALGNAIRTDPNPYVRIEALRAIGVAPVPVSWVPILLDAIPRAEETLPETPFGTQERQTLAKYLRDVKGKLQSIAAEAALRAAQSRPANVPEPAIGPELPLPVGKPPIDWKPWALVGAAVATFAGVVAISRRQRFLAS